MADKSCLYLSLTYEQYKNLEAQLKAYKELETMHTTATGYYHRSFRLHVNDSLIMEFHGPIVMADEQLEEQAALRNGQKKLLVDMG